MTTKRPLKNLVTLSVFSLVALAATEASARPQQAWPPGSWFCADAQVQIGTPAQQVQPLPGPLHAPFPAPLHAPAPTGIYQPRPAPAGAYKGPPRPGYV